MSRIVDFGSVNTKVRCLEGDFLNPEQIIKLINCSNFTDTLDFLKNIGPYTTVFKDYNMEELSGRELENLIKKYYIKNYTSLIHYLNIRYKKLLKVMFMKFEVEDIKNVLRGKLSRMDNLNELMTFQCSLSNIDYEMLLKCQSVKQVVEGLKGTPYYKHICVLANNVDSDGMFQLEMALDLVYFIKLRKLAKRLSKSDREVIERLNGIYADLLNIQWIFRGIKFYGLEPEVLFNYTIYDGWKLKKEDVKALCYSRNLNDFYRDIDKSPYKEVFEKCDSEEYLLEREILSYLKRVYIKCKSEFKMDISIVFSYLELSFIQCRDIITIIESKRYGLKSDDIIKLITATE